MFSNPILKESMRLKNRKKKQTIILTFRNIVNYSTFPIDKKIRIRKPILLQRR
jgi:hypothetical protein